MNSTATANSDDEPLFRGTGSDEQLIADEVVPPAARQRSGRPLRKLIVILLLAAGVAWSAQYIHRVMTHAETDDAFITGHVHDVSARIAGTVTEILFEENQEVKAGDVLVRLDPADAQSKLAEYEAMLNLAKAKVTQADSELVDSKAKVAQSEAQWQKAEADFQRARDLSKTKVMSQQEYDAARAQSDSTKAGVASSRAGTSASEAAVVAAQAQLKVAEAYVADARLQSTYTTITAPVSGRIGKRNVELGHRVQPGQALLAIVQPEVWVEANFKETQLAKIRTGQQAEVTIDAIPGHQFSAKVESVSPASGAQFAMLPPDNATGNFTKVVQRVPVKLQFDASIRGFEERLRPGLSAVVAVRVDGRRP